MKPSLLVVTPRYPYPVVGGDRLRIYQQCKELSRYFNLTLVSLCETRQELQLPLPNDGVFTTIERYHYPKWKAWLATLMALPTQTPLQVAYYRSRAFQQRVRHLMAAHDAVLAHLIRVGDMVKNQPGIKFLEMTDAISLTYARLKQQDLSLRGWMPWVYRIEANRLHRYEKDIFRCFDHTFLISEVDRRFLLGDSEHATQRTSIVTNGVDLDELPYQFAPTGQDLVFIGNMSAVPNQDAVQYVATEILPLVRRRYPGSQLRVIGRIPSKLQSYFQHLPGVKVMGEVPSIAQAAHGGAVGVCPMRLGAGVQNKLLEYMALGLPAVTTTMGLEGIQAQPGQDVWLADTPELFADEVIALLDNRAAAEVTAQAARRYVERHHAWSSVLAPMVQTMLQHLPDRSIARGHGLVSRP